MGVHKLKAAATDKVGNTAVVENEFTVTVDFNSLSRLTRSFVSEDGVANSLIEKLQAAKEAEYRGNMKAKENILKAYVNELSAQSGKSIDEQQAKILVSLS
ncbi:MULTISPECIES: hypothetical protein [Bacillaceae]|uniref:hypothetical protein n=1 Tax=Bacillaceae TaxID=186817 RepID=UPI002FFE9D0F